MMSEYKVPVMLSQSIKLFHHKLWLKLIGPCMHYHSSSITPIKYKSEKLSKFRTAVILSIIIFLQSISFMHMFNVSTLCMQSIELFHQKLWYKLIGPPRHWLSIHIQKYCLSSQSCHFVKI